MSEDEPFVWTKAHHAGLAARLAKKLNREVGDMVGGMWNPLFCAADASEITGRLLDDIAADIAHYRKVLKRAQKPSETLEESST